jgi:hypothetical protein
MQVLVEKQEIVCIKHTEVIEIQILTVSGFFILNLLHLNFYCIFV